MVTASGEVGAEPSVGNCARLRRELSGEPDAGNLHLRFDEGRGGHGSHCRLLSYSTGSETHGSETRGSESLESTLERCGDL